MPGFCKIQIRRLSAF